MLSAFVKAKGPINRHRSNAQEAFVEAKTAIAAVRACGKTLDATLESHAAAAFQKLRPLNASRLIR